MVDSTPLNWPFFLYGGDYNPDQWPVETQIEDAELMPQARWNVATLPVFGWAALEPSEGVFTFEWLDAVLDRLAAKGVRACFATATASVPAWLTEKYPDVLVVNEHGVRQKHGNRHTFCPNSPNYRRLSTALARAIAERYKDHPALLLWHVNNEYGGYCYCDQCAEAFRGWLQAKYGSLDELNARWFTSFWGHTYSAWSQIDTPTRNGEGSIQALKIDYYRFQSESLLDCFRAEKAVLKEITPDVPVTTNLMGTFFPLDYHQWGRELDVISWDSYPRPGYHYSEVAFAHSVMRGLREGQPFLLMEQTPSQQNWAEYCRLKPPGTLRLLSLQAVAHGADSVMYFQWRRGRGGIEKLHGAVMEHGGTTQNRVFREVAALGEELARTGTRLQGARIPAKVAVLFDWPNWWGLRCSSGPLRDIDYVGIVSDFFHALLSLGIPAEVLSPEADLSSYDVIVAPMLTMLRPDDAARIDEHVKAGATLVTTFFSGLVDATDMVYHQGAPGPWRETLGVFVEETDAVAPDEPNAFVWDDGTVKSAAYLCDRLVLEGADVVATYQSNFYAGEPAVTRNQRGDGLAYYVAARPDAAGTRYLMHRICTEAGLRSPLAEGAAPPENVEVSERISPTGEGHLYLLNHGTTNAVIAIPEGRYEDILTGQTHESTLTIAPFGVAILVAISG